MGLRGQSFVEKNFDEQIVIQRYLAMVQEVASVSKLDLYGNLP